MIKRLLIAFTTSAVLAAVVPTTPARAATQPQPTLTEPAGQTAVKGGDIVRFGGSADAGSTLVSAALAARLLDDEGNLEATGATQDVTQQLKLDQTTGQISGSAYLGYGVVAAPAEFLVLEVTVDDVTDPGSSDPVPVDIVAPRISRIAVIEPTIVKVDFSEPATSPTGDKPSDWTVKGVAPAAVTGEGDHRLLHVAPLGEDEGPLVQYVPRYPVSSPYQDGAHNKLTTDLRSSHAADMPPRRPLIASVAGDSPAEWKVRSNDATPLVRVDNVTDGHMVSIEATWVDAPSTKLRTPQTVVAPTAARNGGATLTTAELREGRHELVAIVEDPNENVSRSDAVTYELDISAAVNIDDAPPPSTPAANVLFEFSSEPEASFVCTLERTRTHPDDSANTLGIVEEGSCNEQNLSENSQTLGSKSYGTNLSPLAEGDYTFRVQATDSLRNVSEFSSHVFTVDRTAPSVALGDSISDEMSVINPQDGSYVKKAVARFTFDATDQFARQGSSTRFLCRLNSASDSWGECVSSVSYSLSDGTHTFEVKAVDAAGNSSPVAARSFTVDTEAPIATIGEVASDDTSVTNPLETSRISKTAARFTFDSDPNSTFECQLEHGEDVIEGFTLCDSGKTYWPLVEGAYTFSVRATDLADNLGPATQRSFIVDVTAPTITLATPSHDASSTDLTPEIEGTAGTHVGDDESVTVKIWSGESATGAPVLTLDTPIDMTAGTYSVSPVNDLGPGTYTVQAFQSDAALNEGASSANTFSIESSAGEPEPSPSVSPTPSPSSTPSVSASPSPTADPSPGAPLSGGETSSATDDPSTTPSPSPTDDSTASPDPTASPSPSPPDEPEDEVLGQIDATTVVNIRFDRDAAVFKGAVRSDYQTCGIDRVVKLLKVRRGHDRVVATDRTNGRSRWKISGIERLPRGRYYARVARETFLHDNGTEITCLADRSASVRLARPN